MRTQRILPLILAMSVSFFSLCSSQASNDNSQPLKSVLPGVGNGASGGVGVDLATECMSGSVLPAANGGTGSALAFPLSVTLGGTGAATLTTHGPLLGTGTSAVQAAAAGTTGQAFVSGGASANGAYGVALPIGGGTGSAVAPTDGQVPIGRTSTGLYVPASITSSGSTLTVTAGANTLNIDSVFGVKSATYTLTAADIVAMNGAPVTVLAGVSSKTIVPISIDMTYTESTAAYTGGGNISFTYHGGATLTAGTVAATAITAASGSTYSMFSPVSASIATQATGIDITNATGAFVNPGTATGTAVIHILYRTF